MLFSTSHIRACSLDGRFCFGSPASQLHPIPYFQSCYTLVPFFTNTIDSGPLAESASQAVSAERLLLRPLDPYYIQALLLHAIAVYWCGEPRRGRDLLNEAICGALMLGMQRMDFASRYGQGDPVLQESWRRTWWMIYIVDTHIAGSTHSFPTQSGAVEITTGLPCEEHNYDSGVSPLRCWDKNEWRLNPA